MIEIHSLVIIALVAVLAPLINRLPLRVRIPVIVIELLMGVLIGPAGVGWVASGGIIAFLGEFGLIFLFFQAGLEIDLTRFQGVSLRLATVGWFISVAIACMIAVLLYATGLLKGPMLVALALPTTAMGMVLPILRESGDLESAFGRYVAGAAVAGEFGPIFLASLVLAHRHSHVMQTFLTILFLIIAVGAAVLATKIHSERLTQTVAAWMNDSSLLPVRVSILILLTLVSLARDLGMEAVLGAYTAGIVIGLFIRDNKADVLRERLSPLGPGFLIPLFFIVSGVELDLHALLASPWSLARLPLFCALFLLVRGLPAFLYREKLPKPDLLPFALYSSSTLPLVVTIAHVGARTGEMLPENGAALIGAAIVSMSAFPVLALVLRQKAGSDRALRPVAQFDNVSQRDGG
jgi:Kef-type K+ transport system membrane component KefB